MEDFARVVPSMSRPQQEEQVAAQLARHGIRVRAGDALAESYCAGTPSGTRPLPALVVRYSTVDLTQLPTRVAQGIGNGAYHSAEVGACSPANQNGFTAYQIVILLY